ncbi:MAG: hypothetical protein K9H49_13540 [Bacteroidales bacterium]|nr:hypothetical protein [Bacteroidales bacterium]MCF8406168.1 hypothetical protein [Bacteroidales bacterium]
MKIKLMHFASIFLLSLFILTSCNKENPTDILDEVQELAITVDDMNDEVMLDAVFDEILNEIIEDEFFKSTGCPLKTVETPDSTRFPRVVTKDYGDGCETENGVFHSGVIIITYESNPKIPGSLRTVEFINYGRNENVINGQERIKFVGLTEEGYVHYSINGSINLLKPDSVEVKRVKHKERFKIAGIDTPERGDDEWLIEGRVKVYKSTGIHYLMKIVSPLHIVNSCDYLVSGSKFITVYQKAEELDTENGNEFGTILIDFGDGTCDNIATKSVNDGEPEEITLK